MPTDQEKVAKAFDLLLKRAKKTADDCKKMEGTKLKFRFKGLVKVYTDAVKKGGSLVTARPATLKLVQAAEKSATADSVKKAVKALEEHVKEATKEAGKSGAKELSKFDKAIADLIKRLKSHLK